MQDMNLSRLRQYTLHDGIKKLLEAVFSAENLRPANPTANEGESGENHERNGHRARGFVNMFLDVLVGAAVVNEGQEKEAGHVKNGHGRGGEFDESPKKEAGERPGAEFI